MIHTPYWKSLLVVTALGLAACTSTSVACTLTLPTGGEDPKNQDCIRHAMQLRDSIFHSYMDSLDSRIHELNGVAQRVDSLARLFKEKGRVKLHLDGKSFGPIHIPSTKIEAMTNSNPEQSTPAIETPEVIIPGITVPDVDIEIGGEEALMQGGPDGVLGDRTSGRVEVRGYTNGPLTFGTDVYDDSYTQGNRKYYMRSVKPNRRALRVPVAGNVWLLTK